MGVKDKIHEQVTGNRVVLYMKGTPTYPMCGFSATAAEILKRCGVDGFLAVNVLEPIRVGGRLLVVGGEDGHHCMGDAHSDGAA